MKNPVLLTGLKGDTSSIAWIDDMRRGLTPVTADQSSRALSSLLAALGDSLPASTRLRLAESLPEPFRASLLREWDGPDDGDRTRSIVAKLTTLLPADFPQHACLVTRVGLAVLCDHLDADLVLEVAGALPERTRRLWPPQLATRLEGKLPGVDTDKMRIAC